MRTLEILQILTAFISMYAVGAEFEYAYIFVLVSGAIAIIRYIRNGDIASIVVQAGVVISYLVGLINK